MAKLPTSDDLPRSVERDMSSRQARKQTKRDATADALIALAARRGSGVVLPPAPPFEDDDEERS